MGIKASDGPEYRLSSKTAAMTMLKEKTATDHSNISPSVVKQAKEANLVVIDEVPEETGEDKA